MKKTFGTFKLVRHGEVTAKRRKEHVHHHKDVPLMFLNLLHESAAAATIAEMTKFDRVVGPAVGGAHPVWKQWAEASWPDSSALGLH